MSNVVELRPKQPYTVGSLVRIGDSSTVFEVCGLGLCGPVETELGPHGVMVNASEFVQLQVPGMPNRCFNIHVSFLRRGSHPVQNKHPVQDEKRFWIAAAVVLLWASSVMFICVKVGSS